MFRKFLDSLTIKNLIIYLAGLICICIFISSFFVSGTITTSSGEYSFSNIIYGARSYTANLDINYLGINGTFEYSQAKNFPAIGISIIGYILVLAIGILLLITPKYFKYHKYYKIGSYVIVGLLLAFVILIFIGNQVFLSSYAKVLELDIASESYVRASTSFSGSIIWIVIASGLVIYSNYAKDIYLTPGGLHFYKTY